MHKTLIPCIIIILFVIVLNIVTEKYTTDSIYQMTEKLEDLKQELKEENNKEINKVNEKMEETMKLWYEINEKMAYFVEHDELEKVETELTSLKSNIEIEEYEQGIPDLDKAIFILNHIQQKFKLDIKNIF